MSIWRRPRERIGGTGESVDDGMVRADELLEFVLPKLWGEEFSKSALRLLPQGIEPTPSLRDAFDLGRMISVARRFREALASGRLVARVRLEEHSAGAKRISASVWESAYLDGILYLLRTGSGYPLALDVQIFSDSPTVIFLEKEAKDWLDEIACISAPPDPRTLDETILKNNFVTASQGVSWLAGQSASDWGEYAHLAAELREVALQLSRLPETERFGQEYYVLCERLAVELANKASRNRAALALLEACAEGRLRGLCCVNRVRDSSRESSVVAGRHEQTHTPRLQDQELADL